MEVWGDVIGRGASYFDPYQELVAKLGHDLDRETVLSRRKERHNEMIAELEVLPQIFMSEAYAFSLPDGSPIRDSIDSALRRALDGAPYRNLKDRYLSAENREVCPDCRDGRASPGSFVAALLRMTASAPMAL